MPHARDISPVLLIEDDDDTRETMQLLLELKGFRVSTARDGREGLRAIENGEEPCIILLDWMMPRMNGREFLEALRNDARFAHIPVIVVTAFAGQDPSIPARHLKKPVSTDELVSEVSAYCCDSC